MRATARPSCVGNRLYRSGDHWTAALQGAPPRSRRHGSFCSSYDLIFWAGCNSMSDFDRLDSVLKAYQASFIGKVYNEENDDHDLLMDAFGIPPALKDRKSVV